MEVIDVRKASLQRKGFSSLAQWLEVPDHVYIGRDMTKYVEGAVGSKWGNPFKKDSGSIEQRLEWYEEHVRSNPSLMASLPELRGKILGCWCHPKPCHGHILAKLVRRYVVVCNSKKGKNKTSTQQRQCPPSWQLAPPTHQKPTGAFINVKAERKGRPYFQTLAEETMKILEEKNYLNQEYEMVDLSEPLVSAVDGTMCHSPDDPTLLEFVPWRRHETTRISVSLESTVDAIVRLQNLTSASAEGSSCVAALNFASAKNPGGGFLRGANAQEEALARSSALHACLTAPQSRTYYAANRRTHDGLYTDHLIYSPGVPFFRDGGGALLARPAVAAVVTAPAPNRGVAERHFPFGGEDAVAAALRVRASRVLAAAAVHGHSRLVLGAWGCGVFRNDPREVAGVFRAALSGPFAAVFEEVVFAIKDREEGATVRAFREAFTDEEVGGEDSAQAKKTDGEIEGVGKGRGDMGGEGRVSDSGGAASGSPDAPYKSRGDGVSGGMNDRMKKKKGKRGSGRVQNSYLLRK